MSLSQCKVTHQLPFVCASSSICQHPGHTGTISINCNLSSITVVQKKPLAPCRLWLWFKAWLGTSIIDNNINWSRHCHCPLNVHLILNLKKCNLLHVYICCGTSLQPQFLFIPYPDPRAKRPTGQLFQTCQRHRSSCRFTNMKLHPYLKSTNHQWNWISIRASI